MPWTPPPGNGGSNSNNPWGKGGSGGGNEGPRSPWGSGNRGGDPQPPDLDELLRKAQQNFRQVMPGGQFGGDRVLGLMLVAIIALWLASGFYIIEPGMHGVVQRFGAWSRTQTEEGLGYRLPWPVESVTRLNVSEMRRMEIGFTDEASRAGAGRRDIPDESLMLTSDANIVDINLIVLWNVKSAEDFLFNIRDPENTIKKVGESAIREVVGQTSMFPIITTERAAVAKRAQDIMTANLDSYKSGVNITQVLIQEAEVHPDVQDAFQDVQSAKQDAIDVQNRALAYRQDIIPKARGQAIKMRQEAEAYKQSIMAKAQGDASRFDAVYEAYKGAQDVTKTRIYIETMEDVFRNAQKILVDDGNKSGVVPYLPLNELKPAAGSPSSSDDETTSGSN